MPLAVTGISVDLIADMTSVNFAGELSAGKHGNVSVYVPIKTPGNKPESDLKKIAREAAKDALREALRALEDR